MSLVIYLDYDGVVHNSDVIVDRTSDGERFPASRGPGQLMQWAPVLELLLQPYPEVRLCLSTRWCWWFGVERTRNFLPQSLATRVIGGTWEGCENMPEGWVHWDRHRQCRFHAERHGIDPECWFAIDDDDRGLASDDRANFVITAPWAGLSEDRAVREIEQKLRSFFSRQSARQEAQ